MSYSFSFFARDVYHARQRLKDSHAPAAVQALVELCFAGIREPAPVPGTQAATAPKTDSSSGARAMAAEPRAPRFAGVFVESWGHIDETGSKSWIERFVVQPMFE